MLFFLLECFTIPSDVLILFLQKAWGVVDITKKLRKGVALDVNVTQRMKSRHQFYKAIPCAVDVGVQSCNQKKPS